MRDLKPLIPRTQREERQIEFVTNQHCNFRCFGCDSFSDIIKTPNFDNLVKEDIINWSKVLVPLSNQSLINCKKVKFIGGETLLTKNLGSFLKVAAENFTADWEIAFHTNGLLLKKNEELIRLCNDLNVRIYITIHFKDKKYLDRLLENINFTQKFIKDIRIVNSAKYWYSFHKYDRGKIYPFDNDSKLMYENCFASSCRQILNGYMYKCSKLSNLHAALKQTNQLDDPQWKKYLEYKPIHYSNSKEEIVKFFNEKEEDICSGCNTTETYDNVTKMNGMTF